MTTAFEQDAVLAEDLERPTEEAFGGGDDVEICTTNLKRRGDVLDDLHRVEE